MGRLTSNQRRILDELGDSVELTDDQLLSWERTINSLIRRKLVRVKSKKVIVLRTYTLTRSGEKILDGGK